MIQIQAIIGWSVVTIATVNESDSADLRFTKEVIQMFFASGFNLFLDSSIVLLIVYPLSTAVSHDN